jgi:hypothetical protein
MWHHCGCNLGCAGVAVPRAELHEGMRVRVISGHGRGAEAEVVSPIRIDGGRALALDTVQPEGWLICGGSRAAVPMGFLCDGDRSGPVPMDACADGCD